MTALGQQQREEPVAAAGLEGRPRRGEARSVPVDAGIPVDGPLRRSGAPAPGAPLQLAEPVESVAVEQLPRVGAVGAAGAHHAGEDPLEVLGTTHPAGREQLRGDDPDEVVADLAGREVVGHQEAAVARHHGEVSRADLAGNPRGPVGDPVRGARRDDDQLVLVASLDEVAQRIHGRRDVRPHAPPQLTRRIQDTSPAEESSARRHSRRWREDQPQPRVVDPPARDEPCRVVRTRCGSERTPAPRPWRP